MHGNSDFFVIRQSTVQLLFCEKGRCPIVQTSCKSFCHTFIRQGLRQLDATSRWILRRASAMAPRDALMQIFTLRQICVVKAREWANEPRKGQNEYIVGDT